MSPTKNGDVAELADALDLGSSSQKECRFNSCHPHSLPDKDLRRFVVSPFFVGHPQHGDVGCRMCVTMPVTTKFTIDRQRCLMNGKLITRRRMIQTSSGALIAGALMKSPNLLAQQIASPQEAKDLIFLTTEPRNGELEIAKLVKSWLTPTEQFYVRSHGPNPQIDPKQSRSLLKDVCNARPT